MKRRMLGVVVALLLMVGTASAADWTTALPLFKESVVEIAIGTQGACTGVVIDNSRDLVLTAAHCDVDSDSTQRLLVDNLIAKVRFKDVKNDLMVLHVEGIDRPALALAKDNPKVGDEVASFGYGYALERPLLRIAHISAEDVALERSRYIVVDAAFVGGQSGGPVVNVKGEIVMLVQMGNSVVGMGVGAETLHDKVGRLFTLPGAK